MDNYDTEIRPLLTKFCGKKQDFDPLRSHSDCHALIEELRNRGWLYHREDWSAKNTMQQFYKTRETSGKRDAWWGYPTDYREGIVTLAAQIARKANG